jgi:PEGA domain
MEQGVLPASSSIIRIHLWIILGLPFMLAGTGCATVMGGHHPQQVKIKSNPQGAMVIVDGQPQGPTPATIALDRKVEHHVQVEMPGYEPTQAVVKPGLNPWVFGNFALGGLIGLGVDCCTDSWHQLYPGSLDVHLRKLDSDSAPAFRGKSPDPPLDSRRLGQ